MRKICILMASLVLLSSCASVFTGTSQSIQVRATDIEQNELSKVSCRLVDNAGVNYQINDNPGTVRVPKGQGAMQINCKEPGYQSYNGAITSSLNPVVLLDILFWPTFIVDFATGAAMKYPGHYNVIMNPKD